MDTETFFKDEFRTLLLKDLNDNDVYTKDEVLDICECVLGEILNIFRITEERFIDD